MACRTFLNTAKSGGGEGDPKQARAMMREMMGPQAVDEEIRRAIRTCWMMLPEEKRNLSAVEAEIKRLVARALKDLEEDCAAYGIPAGKK